MSNHSYVFTFWKLPVDLFNYRLKEKKRVERHTEIVFYNAGNKFLIYVLNHSITSKTAANYRGI